jgi:hypothetical protein
MLLRKYHVLVFLKRVLLRLSRPHNLPTLGIVSAVPLVETSLATNNSPTETTSWKIVSSQTSSTRIFQTTDDENSTELSVAVEATSAG